MTRLSAPRYDRFKTVVAVILGIILLLMLLRGCATNVVPAAPEETQPAAAATALPQILRGHRSPSVLQNQMDRKGFEPSTSSLRTRRSAS